MPLVKDPNSPSGYRYESDTIAQYPALDLKPSGEAVNPTTSDNRDLYPDPFVPDVPHGPAYGGAPYGPTNSSVREQRARRLQRAMDIEDAIMADGQNVERFDVTAGAHTGRGVNEPTRSAADLREQLLRADGQDDASIALDRAMRNQ